jgi:hypothetical protein
MSFVLQDVRKHSVHADLPGNRGGSERDSPTLWLPGALNGVHVP